MHSDLSECISCLSVKSSFYSLLDAERNMVMLVYTATAMTSHCSSDNGIDFTTNAASSTPTIPAAAKANDACLWNGRI